MLIIYVYLLPFEEVHIPIQVVVPFANHKQGRRSSADLDDVQSHACAYKHIFLFCGLEQQTTWLCIPPKAEEHLGHLEVPSSPPKQLSAKTLVRASAAHVGFQPNHACFLSQRQHYLQQPQRTSNHLWSLACRAKFTRWLSQQSLCIGLLIWDL